MELQISWFKPINVDFPTDVHVWLLSSPKREKAEKAFSCTWRLLDPGDRDAALFYT